MGGEKRLRWRSKHLASSHSGVPNVPGVYLIGHAREFHGIELERVYVYVGESKNLQRRLKEHLPVTEQNAGLRRYLSEYYADVKCWYTPTDLDRRVAIQDELIREIQPCFNTQGL